MDIHQNSKTSPLNPYQNQENSTNKPEQGIKGRISNIFKRCYKKITRSSSISSGKKVRSGSVGRSRVSSVSKHVFANFRGKETISENDFDRIMNYVNKNKETLFKKPGYYRKEKTDLPNTIQVQVPKKAKSSDDLVIHVHLKDWINEGAEKFLKLSFSYDMKNQEIHYVATGTPRSTSKTENPEPTPRELLKAKRRFEKEIAMLKRFEGKKGVVQLKGHAVYAVKGYTAEQRPKVNMVFEVAESDLFDTLVKLHYAEESVKQKWKRGSKRKQYAYNILQGLDNIHKEGVIHFDIKLDNILICEGKAKIADFGFAADEANLKKKFRGTPIYLSSEMLKLVKFKFEEDKYRPGSQKRAEAESYVREYERLIGKKTDVYSTGICLYFLKYLDFPTYIYRNKDQKTDSDVLRPDNVDDHINELHQWYESFQPDDEEGLLIKDMLNPDPRERITAAKALARMKKIKGEKL